MADIDRRNFLATLPALVAATRTGTRAAPGLTRAGPANAGAEPQGAPTDQWRLVVLGIAQDAGIPQLGCTQALCQSIWAGRRKRERVSCLGLFNRARNRAYLFDATPDFVTQVHDLTGDRAPDAIFLTHAHIGHYPGLMYLGREAMNTSKVPVYGTERMRAFLTANGPWSLLVSLGNIDVHVLAPGTPVDLGDGIRVTALLVPHRAEFTDTVGYRIAGPNRKVLFIPDIDQWQKWSMNIRDVVESVDEAFLDGTFAAADEIPGRSIADIPHPLMPATRELLRGVKARVWFIHINHTNTQLDAPDVARQGMEIAI
jgi:pyrroloquinoline quinone biosynthesis protein B